MTTREILRENLKYYRKRTNLTQEELAEKIGCSSKYISSIESKSTFPSPENLDLLAEALKIKPSQLFEERGCPTNAIAFSTKEFTNTILNDLHEKLKTDVLDYLEKIIK